MTLRSAALTPKSLCPAQPTIAHKLTRHDNTSNPTLTLTKAGTSEAPTDNAVPSAVAVDLTGDPLRERLRAREKRVVAGLELNESNFLLDALTLHLRGSREILCAHEVRRGFLVPGDLAGWLHERREGLSGETGDRLFGRDLVAILEEELPDEVGVDADGAVISWH
jgi:hypothetical protein